ncbi:MAG: methylated-DNA--[protein]-cysteine S-methyltransferase [Bacteroidetes bacterium]|nr:methylated-DNA--[protein]-cysteine S-methyltransferase [Bacteroidota bacterium]
MNHIHIHYLKTSYGDLILGSYENKLCLCDWRYRKMRTTIDERLIKGLKATFLEKEDELLNNTCLQLGEYFASERKQFDIPLLMVGSDFQQKVWKELLNISYGETSTYLRLSEKIENANAVRAVANANGANAISIIIPCHRIIGSNGKLVGYAGGLQTKGKLLSLEKKLTNSSLDLQFSFDF